MRDNIDDNQRRQQSFTDDDLKRLKSNIHKNEHLHGCNLYALLARLETSEKLNYLAFSHIKFDDCSECGFALKAWRKSKGE